MTPDETRLINDLFDRLAQHGPISKDRQADTLIQQRLRQMPDAAYMLVQSAIVYQHQIAANEDRIRDLEEQLSGADADTSGGSSFLGGLLGGGREPPRPPMPRPEPQRTASPWGGTQMNTADREPPRGGGFLSSALSTATGVAGGMMIAESLRGLFGGEAHARDSFGSTYAADQAALKDADRTQDELQDEQLAQDQQDDADTDADFDSGGDSGIDV